MVKKIVKIIYNLIFPSVKKDFSIQDYDDSYKIKKYPPVTFIIPARNEEKSIEKCIKAIIYDNYFGTEIIVLDDVSSDNTVNIVQKLQKKYSKKKGLLIKLVLNEQRLGPSPNRNKAGKMASGEILIMFDAHSIINSKNFVKTYLKYFADPKVGAVAGGRSWQPKYYQDQVLFYAGGLRPWKEMGFQFLDNPNAAYRKKVFNEMGGIDTHIVWGSDLSSTFKVLGLGYKIPVAPDASIEIDHAITPNRKTDFIRKPFLYGTNIVYLLNEHFKWLIKRRVDVIIVGGGLVNLTAIILFLIMPQLWFLPVATISILRLHSIVFSLINKAPIKYIIGIPFILTISEISYAVGFLVGIFRKIFGLKSWGYSQKRKNV